MTVPAIAVINAGSSSLKFSLYALQGDGLQLRGRGQVEGLGTGPRFIARDAAGATLAEQRWPAPITHDAALDHVTGFLRERDEGFALRGVGHRVVHGGLAYHAPTRLTPEVVDALQAFVPLAPLHQPHNLGPIRRLLQASPELPQVACFDTAFHRTNPELAQMFALPHALHEAGVRRYGFHGLSYEYVASVLPRLAPAAAAGRTLVLHLGNGASICALQRGRSVASTMGFTAVDGLMMGTRTGALDPGVVLYLMDERGLDARAVERLIYSESGLLGVSGLSSDMRTLLASAEPRAKLAVDLFVYRIGREIGSLAASLGGLDAIVFTAGIGENSAPVRARVAEAAAWLGVQIDPAANEAGADCISTASSRVTVWVVPTDEELMIARHTLNLLSADEGSTPRAAGVARGDTN
jgi:acetate kinase